MVIDERDLTWEDREILGLSGWIVSTPKGRKRARKPAKSNRGRLAVKQAAKRSSAR